MARGDLARVRPIRNQVVRGGAGRSRAVTIISHPATWRYFGGGDALLGQRQLPQPPAPTRVRNERAGEVTGDSSSRRKGRHPDHNPALSASPLIGPADSCCRIAILHTHLPQPPVAGPRIPEPSSSLPGAQITRSGSARAATLATGSPHLSAAVCAPPTWRRGCRSRALAAALPAPVGRHGPVMSAHRSGAG